MWEKTSLGCPKPGALKDEICERSRSDATSTYSIESCGSSGLVEDKALEASHAKCSDNTHIDHLHDEIGIQNVYFGRYGGSDGPGIDALVRAVDPGLGAEIQAALNTALDAIEEIPTPFDQSIQGSDSSPARQAIIGAVGALRDQTEVIEEVAAALDVDITTAQ